MFQPGNIYTAYQSKSDRPLRAQVRNIAPRCRQYAVISDNNGSITLSGKFPPTDERVLLP
jgi:hypothetical protein